MCLRCLETNVDTDLFPLRKPGGPCKQIDYTESIANTCHFQLNANYLPPHCQGLRCVPGSECMCKLLQHRKADLFMLQEVPVLRITDFQPGDLLNYVLVCIAVRAKSVVFFTHLYERHTTARAFKHSIAVIVLDGSDSPVPLAQNRSFFLVSQFWFIFLSKTQAASSPGCLSNPFKPEFLIPLLAFPAASIQPSLQVTDAHLTLSKPLQTWWSVGVRITPSSSTCYPQYQGQCLPHSVTQHMSK